jgi:flagellar hook assembly protein FlgD
LSDAAELLGIKYDEFIPLLIAGYQTQQASMIAQQALIDDQQGELANQIVMGEEQGTVIASLESQLAEQAATIEALQDQMATVLQSVQAMQAKTANCCQENGSVEQGYNSNSSSEGDMKLGQNVPNPFADFTRIDFELPNEAQIKLEISDVNGRSIDQLINGQMSAGLHTIQWDGSSLAPGVYFYSLYSNGQLLTKKMIKR